MPESENVPLSDEVLSMMRAAAQKALELNEPFISLRALLLAMLDEPSIGPRILGVVNREKLLEAEPAGGAMRLDDDVFTSPGDPPLARYDTIAFKTPDNRSSVWLSSPAYQIFIEGARRVQERYLPKHVALGMAAQAVNAPGSLAALPVEPGALADALYKL